MANWQVIEGRGAEHLDRMAADVALWQRWGADLPALEDRLDDIGEQAAYTANQSIEWWLEENHRGKAVDHVGYMAVNENQRGVLTLYAEAALARAAYQKMDALKQGVPLDATDKRARIHVIGDGVMRSTGFVEPGHGIDIRRKFKPVEAGVVLEGKIRKFRSIPRVGGWMQLEHGGGFVTSFVNGFVNKTDGQPQVELEILEKTKKR